MALSDYFHTRTRHRPDHLAAVAGGGRWTAMSTPGADTPPELTAEQADATIRSRPFVGLLVAVAVIGVIVSIAAWCLLEAIFQIQQELYATSRTRSAIRTARRNGGRCRSSPSARIVALAITRLPGRRRAHPREGPVSRWPLGPGHRAGSAPRRPGDDRLRAGARAGGPPDRARRGTAGATISLARRDTPPQARMLVAAAGSFAAMSFIFASPLIAAVIHPRRPRSAAPGSGSCWSPGCWAAWIGSLVSLGIGLTGLSTHD